MDPTDLLLGRRPRPCPLNERLTGFPNSFSDTRKPRRALGMLASIVEEAVGIEDERYLPHT